MNKNMRLTFIASFVACALFFWLVLFSEDKSVFGGVASDSSRIIREAILPTIPPKRIANETAASGVAAQFRLRSIADVKNSADVQNKINYSNLSNLTNDELLADVGRADKEASGHLSYELIRILDGKLTDPTLDEGTRYKFANYLLSQAGDVNKVKWIADTLANVAVEREKIDNDENDVVMLEQVRVRALNYVNSALAGNTSQAGKSLLEQFCLQALLTEADPTGDLAKNYAQAQASRNDYLGAISTLLDSKMRCSSAVSCDSIDFQLAQYYALSGDVNSARKYAESLRKKKYKDAESLDIPL
jgi:hypothetical protein